MPSKLKSTRGVVKTSVPFTVLHNTNGAGRAATNTVNKGAKKDVGCVGESSTGAQESCYRKVLGQCNRPLGAIPRGQHPSAQPSTSKSSMRIAESVVKKMINGELPVKAQARKKVPTLAELIHNYHYRTPERCRPLKPGQQPTRIVHGKLKVTVPKTPVLKTLQRVRERQAAKK